MVFSAAEMSTTNHLFKDEVETSEDEMLKAPEPMKLPPVPFLHCHCPPKLWFEDDVKSSEDERLDAPNPTKLPSVLIFLYRRSTESLLMYPVLSIALLCL